MKCELRIRKAQLTSVETNERGKVLQRRWYFTSANVLLPSRSHTDTNRDFLTCHPFYGCKDSTKNCIPGYRGGAIGIWIIGSYLCCNSVRVRKNSWRNKGRYVRDKKVPTTCDVRIPCSGIFRVLSGIDEFNNSLLWYLWNKNNEFPVR